MWWKHTNSLREKGLEYIVLLGFFLFTVSTPVVSDMGAHFARQEMYVNAKAYAGTLDLDWSPVQGADEYEILWSSKDMGYFINVDTVEGFGYAISPYQEGVYKIIALKQGERIEIDTVMVKK